MRTQANIKVLAILPADSLRHKCLSSFFFSLFSVFTLELRERERENIQWQYLGRVEGENGFKIYSASSTDFFWDFFLFTDERDSEEFGLKAPVILLSKILSALPRSFGDSFNTSCHANCCPETRLRFFARSFGIRSHVLSRRSPS